MHVVLCICSWNHSIVKCNAVRSAQNGIAPIKVCSDLITSQWIRVDVGAMWESRKDVVDSTIICTHIPLVANNVSGKLESSRQEVRELE
jgi:hypothetical protein